MRTYEPNTHVAAVYFASRFGGARLDEDILDLLIEYGASLNRVDKYKGTFTFSSN